MGFFKNLFSQPEIDWSRHTSIESALILASLFDYFDEIPEALEAIGAKRRNSSKRGENMVDCWVLPNGQTVYAGYRYDDAEMEGVQRAIRQKMTSPDRS